MATDMNLIKQKPYTKQEVEKATSQSMSAISSETTYANAIANGLEEIVSKLTKYQKLCGLNVLTAINNELRKENLTFTSPSVDKSTINNALKFAMIYGLNIDNNELYVITRRVYADKNNFYWKIECKPQYRGIIKIVEKYGSKVKRVHPIWIVYEGDEFTFPRHEGIKVIPPIWQPNFVSNKVKLVVVPIEYQKGLIDYRIGTRESVATNLKAQINQTLLGKNDRDKILAKINKMSLDEMLEDELLRAYISPTYKGISQEEMLITKMIINAVRRVPIDFSTVLSKELYENTYDTSDVYQDNHYAISEQPLVEEYQKDNGIDDNEISLDKNKELLNLDEEDTEDVKVEDSKIAEMPLKTQENDLEQQKDENSVNDLSTLFKAKQSEKEE